MTITEFRTTPELVSEIRKLLEDHTVLKMWLDALEGTNPAKEAAPVGIQSHDAFIMLGEQTGWMNYRDLFRTGGTPIETPKPVGTQADQDYSKSAEEILADEAQP